MLMYSRYVDIQNIMGSYQLGPNGALILSSDMIATKIEGLQKMILIFLIQTMLLSTHSVKWNFLLIGKVKLLL